MQGTFCNGSLSPYSVRPTAQQGSDLHLESSQSLGHLHRGWSWNPQPYIYKSHQFCSFDNNLISAGTSSSPGLPAQTKPLLSTDSPKAALMLSPTKAKLKGCAAALPSRYSLWNTMQTNSQSGRS